MKKGGKWQKKGWTEKKIGLGQMPRGCRIALYIYFYIFVYLFLKIFSVLNHMKLRIPIKYK